MLQGFGILDYLLLIQPEFGSGGLLQSDRQGGDGVVVWTTLVTREDGEIDGAFEIV